MVALLELDEVGRRVHVVLGVGDAHVVEDVAAGLGAGRVAAVVLAVGAGVVVAVRVVLGPGDGELGVALRPHQPHVLHPRAAVLGAAEQREEVRLREPLADGLARPGENLALAQQSRFNCESESSIYSILFGAIWSFA